MKFLIVIPARGGSKGIPRKNLRQMNGKPLIAYSIENAKKIQLKYDASIVVDTDDEEIAETAAQYGAEFVMRPKYLSGDDVTLDPVIYHAVSEMQDRKKCRFDVIITMQATSPTLKAETIINAIDYFTKGSLDTLISGVNRPHLSWHEKDGKTLPDYEERKNRQYLPKHLMETGGFLISRAECVDEKTRIGKNTEVFEISENEAVDIDSEQDWIVCEAVLSSKKILFRADGCEALGMGHIYRTLSLAYHLIGNQILFVTRKDFEMGCEKLKESFFPMICIESDEELYKIIDDYRPDIVVNDILNTDEEYMKRIRDKVPRIVNFEDKGTGAAYADAVINALYSQGKLQNEYSGFEYFFIRDEFLTVKPKEFSKEVKNVVVLFGGTDPSDLTRRVYKIFQNVSKDYKDIKFNIITGFGYKYKNEIKNDEEHNIYVYNNVKRVSKFLAEADMAVTAQGRTIYELASMGIPAIVLAQNTREMEHDFAGFSNGFINLGLGQKLEDEAIELTVRWLIQAVSVRKQMHELLLEKDFSKGQEKVIKLILDK